MSGETRNVLVTGCSSGIGYTVALGLSARGYKVFATCRQADDVDKLRRLGLDAYQLDLGNHASIGSAVTQILEACDNRLFALFNNGAYGQPGALEDLTTDVLRQQFETNFFGWHELTRQILPVMRKNGEGRIIQNSSLLGYVSLPFRGAYNASKHAIEGWSDTLRLELALSNTPIHISLIEPGPVTSHFRANAMRAFQKNVRVSGSAYELIYQGMINRLNKQGDAAPFTLPPEAVLEKVIHALESPRPKPRYYVTVPSYLFGYLKRLLSTRQLDKVLLSVARRENG
ncbi:unnamed protein product [Cyprideis torosa]|uniref:Uncharacterized protein n=1 Tax=Cyprideis torosa TaxID=163714 RepID=A0A7R8WS09_9CRUS|nr:unnamed protein product [Cyprideis torosa]CAG0909107.1 unnamed protein product [Cyprideis torosa]